MSLHVHRVGNGPDLALIHGWGFPGQVWAPVVAPLAEKFRVHCVDLPGYGGSRDLPADSIQHIADEVMAVLPDEVSLCGWSLGAQVALAALSRHPRRVRELILVAASPCFLKRADWPDAIDPFMLDMFDAALRRDPGALLGRFAMLVNQGDTAAREIAQSLAALTTEPPATTALAQGLALLRDLDLRPFLARVPHRTLLIHGAHDPLMPLPAARRTAAALPHAQLEIFETAAHAPFLSQPERFAQAVIDFALATVDTSENLC